MTDAQYKKKFALRFKAAELLRMGGKCACEECLDELAFWLDACPTPSDKLAAQRAALEAAHE